MKIRYLYLDSSGNLQGPLWLSQMRELFSVGRVTKRTEVCPEGTQDWGVLENFPEITAAEAGLDQALASHGASPKAAYERRMWLWLVALLVLYGVYAVVNYR